MAEAGLANGVELSLQIRQSSITDTQLATVLKEQWKQIGVELNLVPLERSVYRQRELDRQYGNMSVSIWTNDMNDPTQVMRSTIAASPNYAHLTGYNSPRVNELIDQAESEQDRTKREAMYKEI